MNQNWFVTIKMQTKNILKHGKCSENWKIFYTIIFLFFLNPCVLAYASGTNEQIPHSVRSVLLKASLYMQKDNFKMAIDTIKKYQAKQPDNMKIKDAWKKYQHHYLNFYLGNLYLQTNNILNAIICYKATLKANTNFNGAWINLAKCYYDINKFYMAGNCFFKAYEASEETKPDLLCYSAVSYMLAEKSEKSLELFMQLLSNHKNEIKLDWKIYIARLYLILEQNLKALPFLEEIAAQSKGDKKKKWRKIVTQQYILLKMNKKAVSYLLTILQDDPMESDWWEFLSHIFLSNEKLTDALTFSLIKYYIEPLSANKKLIADLSLNVGIPIQAIKYYQEVIETEKDNMDLYYNLAISFLAFNKPYKALATVDKALSNSFSEKLCMLKGKILFEQEKYKQAMQYYEKNIKNIKKANNSGDAWMMMGYAAWNIQDMFCVKQAFTNALKYDKHKKRAKKLLEQINKT